MTLVGLDGADVTPRMAEEFTVRLSTEAEAERADAALARLTFEGEPVLSRTRRGSDLLVSCRVLTRVAADAQLHVHGAKRTIAFSDVFTEPRSGHGSASRIGEHRMLGQRHSWIWMVLAPETRLIWCLGDDLELPELLRRIGYEVRARPLAEVAAGEAPPPDAILIAGNAKAAMAAANKAAAAINPGGVVAVQVAGGPRVAPRRVARVVRALELATSPLAAALAELVARRLEREMRRTGLEVLKLRTGDRARAKYGLGRGGWLSRGRIPVGSIVIGRRERKASVVEVAGAEAALTLKRTLSPREVDVVGSGKMGMRLVDSQGEFHHLSIIAAETATGMRRAHAAIEAILGANPPAALRDRIIAPTCNGQVGPVEYLLEPHAFGRHAVWATNRLWDDCLEFLTALHHLPRQSNVTLERAWPNIDEAAEFIARVAGGHQLKLVEHLHHDITARIHGLPLGAGHGDFWSKNLMVRAGRLHAVLDWEWASGDSLPLIDLLDFRAQMALGARLGLPPGRNFTEVLWPLIRKGGDERVRRLAEATGTPTDADTLEGLVVAHWLLRTARAGLVLPQRVEDPVWIRDNVVEPLALLKKHHPTAAPDRPPSTSHRRLRAPLPTGETSRSEKSDVIVLAYHAVSEKWPCELAVTQRQLEAQVRLLIDRGFRAATFSEAVLAPSSSRMFAITFDDAYRSTFDLAYPILARLGIPATVFVPTAFPGRDSPMTWPEIEHWLDGPHERELLPVSWTQLSQLVEAGWEVGSHTHSHARLTQLDDDSLARELRTSRRECEAHLAWSCQTLAYPYGDDDPRVIKAAETAGYEAACTLSRRVKPAVPLHWPRIGVYRRDHPLRFRLKVSAAIRSARSAIG